ncbi:MAG: DUF5686 and carboxypeptidase regulatory-like domain-containing protein [Mangrovibacterium sp.]
MKTALLLISVIWSLSVFAQQGVKGRIADRDNQVIPYANIYVPALKSGTTSNTEGLFELKLPPGEWDVIFQYIGYQSVTKKLLVDTGFKELVIVLEPQNVKLSEIKVLASGEDPAYYIMRHAIALAPYYEKQVSSYDCKVYLKGTGLFRKIPGLFKKKLEKEGIKKDKAFVMESVNKIHFELPDKLEQQVIAMHNSGKSNSTDPMEMITTNLYNVDKYGIVSPVGRQALKTYRFELLGVFEDQGLTIDKVKVTPRVAQKGTFEGIINIVDNYWNIHSADLKFSMPMFDVSMRQINSLVELNTWMPTSFDFSMDINGFGFGLTYNYVASVSDYKVELNKQLDHSFAEKIKQAEASNKSLAEPIAEPASSVQDLKPASSTQQKIDELLQKEDLSNREMYKLERLMEKETQRSLPPEPLEIQEAVKRNPKAVNNDSVYWAAIRPVPLSLKEKTEFALKDSIIIRQQTQEYQDSARDARIKFKLSDLISGRTYRYGSDSTLHRSWLTIPGIINPKGLNFTTVDGFGYELPFYFSLSDTLGHVLMTSGSARYAFARNTLYATGNLRYRINGLKMRWFGLKGGRTLEDFKGEQGINNMDYQIYALLLHRNFQKFYEKRFFSLQAQTELSNGLQLKTQVGYSTRIPIRNYSDYSFNTWSDREYTENIPDIAGLEDWQLTKSQSAQFGVGLSYTPAQRYRIRQGVKSYAESKFPNLTLNYTGALKNIVGSNAAYSLIRAKISHSVPIGFNDQLNYSINAGKFLNRDRVYTADFYFPASNNQVFSFSNSDQQFERADYHQLFSQNNYIEAHTSFSFDRLLLTRLPLLNQTLISEKLKFHYFRSESSPDYLELSYGLNQIFLLFDIEVNCGINGWEETTTGFRISMKLK